MKRCDECGEEKEQWDLFNYESGLSICKIHSKGYKNSHKSGGTNR